MAAIRSRLLLSLALLGSCADDEEPPPSAAPACEQRAFEGSRFTLCRYDAGAHRLEMIVDDEEGPLRNFVELEEHLGARAERLRFAMNGGMFDEEGMPIGLYVENGRERHALNRADGPGNFHMKPNGVFAVDAQGQVSISTTERYEGKGARWATQSGPMLLIDGELHPEIQPNGQSLHLRNAVCAPNSRTAWFVISDEPVSFGRLARLMRDKLGCRDALYLDGAVSSLWDRPGGRQDPFPALGPMIMVFAR